MKEIRSVKRKYVICVLSVFMFQSLLNFCEYQLYDPAQNNANFYLILYIFSQPVLLALGALLLWAFLRILRTLRMYLTVFRKEGDDLWSKVESKESKVLAERRS